jgi:hypothetical protein
MCSIPLCLYPKECSLVRSIHYSRLLSIVVIISLWRSTGSPNVRISGRRGSEIPKKYTNEQLFRYNVD